MLKRQVRILFRDHTWADILVPTVNGHDSSLPDEITYIYKGKDIRATMWGYGADTTVYQENEE